MGNTLIIILTIKNNKFSCTLQICFSWQPFNDSKMSQCIYVKHRWNNAGTLLLADGR